MKMLLEAFALSHLLTSLRTDYSEALYLYSMKSICFYPRKQKYRRMRGDNSLGTPYLERYV